MKAAAADSSYLFCMGEFLGEVILRALTSVVVELAGLIFVQTAAVVLPIVSFGTLATHDRFLHPPAYGERRPFSVGPMVSAVFGFALWALAVVALIAVLR